MCGGQEGGSRRAINSKGQRKLKRLIRIRSLYERLREHRSFARPPSQSQKSATQVSEVLGAASWIIGEYCAELGGPAAAGAYGGGVSVRSTQGLLEGQFNLA